MRKSLGIVLAAVFALAFVTGVFVADAQADLIPLCWKAGECNYENGTVYTCCLLRTGSGGTHTKCWWDDEYFEQWCL